MQTSAGNGSTPLIRLSDVRKIFLTDEVETHAVSGVHLDIRDGEYVSIAGPSGCGKTTLLSILGLLDSPIAQTIFDLLLAFSFLSFLFGLFEDRGQTGSRVRDSGL